MPPRALAAVVSLRHDDCVAGISRLLSYLERNTIRRLGDERELEFDGRKSKRQWTTQVRSSFEAFNRKPGGDALVEAIKLLTRDEIEAALAGSLEEFTIYDDDRIIVRQYQLADLSQLPDAALIEVARDVFDPDEACERIEGGPWARLFTVAAETHFTSEDEYEAWRDAEEEADADEAEEAVPWHKHLAIEAGRGVDLPPGLEYQERRLLEHQRRSVDKLREWYAGSARAGVLCLPTGAGKTRAAVDFALEVVGSGRVLWLAHRNELVDQAIAAFAEAGGQHTPFAIGRFEAGHRKHREQCDVVVASLPTLAWRKDDELPNVEELLDIHETFDLIIVDECHHAVARTWKAVITKLGARRKVLGLSATPTRTSERERASLWRQLGQIIWEEPILDLVKAGVLARPMVTIVPSGQTYKADTAEQREYQRFKDLPVSLVKRIATDSKRNSLVARTYLEGRDRWGQTLIFAATIEQARSLTRQLRAEGVDCEELFAAADRGRRTDVVQRFRDRKIHVLVNVMLFSEGTDLPGVDSVFIARPTVSDVLFRQMVGRGMRGEAFKGTPVCNVVAFHDDVRGLVDGMLGSTFSEQRTALEALGIGDTPTDANVAAKSPTEPSTSNDHRERLNLLAARLATFPPGQIPRDDWAGIPLEGWWEVHSTTERRFLPVMTDDREVLARFVDEVKDGLRRNVPSRQVKGTLWIVAERLTEFATFATRNQSEPRWIPIANATADDARSFVAILTGTAPMTPIITQQRDWYGIARALESAHDAGDHLFEIGGGPGGVASQTLASRS